MNEKKKIAVIGLKGLPAFGGAATVGESVIEKLKQKYDFTVLSISSHTSCKTGDYNGYKQIVFKTGKRPSGWNTLWYYIRSLLYVFFRNYDLIFLHHGVSGMITPFLRLRFKVVVVFHGTKDDPKFSPFINRMNRFFQKINIKYANIIISVSNEDRKFLEAKYRRKILYIPNGINMCNRFVNHKDNEGYMLFSAGRIYEIKGLHLLLMALNKIEYKGKLLICGDINQKKSYKDLIIKESCNLNVSFIGLIKDKAKLFKIIDDSLFFIFPSLKEAMSMMLLEVVSRGVPVIASDIKGNTDIFTEKEVLFFSSGNSDDLAIKIEYALSNKNEMEQKARNAYNKVKNNYSWTLISSKYEKVFDDLLK